MKGDDLFDMVTLRVLSFMKFPHTVDEVATGLQLPRATIYRRVKKMLGFSMLRVLGRTRPRRALIYVSNIVRMTCLLDRNHYTVRAVFASGDVREETHMLRRGFY